jgi:hypothetical protein
MAEHVARSGGRQGDAPDMEGRESQVEGREGEDR